MGKKRKVMVTCPTENCFENLDITGLKPGDLIKCRDCETTYKVKGSKSPCLKPVDDPE